MRTQLAKPINTKGERWDWKSRDGESGALIIYRQFDYASLINWSTGAIQTLPIREAEHMLSDFTMRQLNGLPHPWKTLTQIP